MSEREERNEALHRVSLAAVTGLIRGPGSPACGAAADHNQETSTSMSTCLSQTSRMAIYDPGTNSP